MTHSGKEVKVEYFRSFSGKRHPLQPVGPVELAEARSLTTYYEARYGVGDRLHELIKHLRQIDDGHEFWTEAFKEQYEYWDSGSLKARTLSIPDLADQTWTYPSKPERLSEYFVELYHNWFVDERSTTPTLAEKSLIFHEQFTEAQMGVFEHGLETSRDNLWVFESTLTLLNCVREIMVEIAPEARIEICAGSLGIDEAQNLLRGFDVPSSLGLFSVMHEKELLENQSDVRALFPDDSSDVELRDWASRASIGTIFVGPVSARSGGKVQRVFEIALTANLKFSLQQAALANSILRRFVISLQEIFETTRGQWDLTEAPERSNDD